MADHTRRKVAVLGGNRIPFARSDGAYAEASNQDMFTATLDGLVDRFGLQGERLGAVIGGAVLKHSRDFNLMRECVLSTSLSPYTPAFDIQQACGTGLQAAIAAADGIAAGRYEVAAAGGVDTTSDAPIGLGDNLRRSLLAVRRAKSNVDRLKLAGRLPAALGVEIPTNGEPRTGLSMGEHAAITAKKMGIKRVDQDQLAAASHRNMAAAYDRGFFDDLVTPFLGVYRDNNLRADATPERLAGLKPVFGVKGGDATMTAGNSTPLTDGASVALLASEEWAQAHGHAVLAYFVDAETAAVDYVNGDDGLLMAPTYAVPRLLARNGLALSDFDFYEIHEAFASVVLCHLQAWESEEYCKERLGLDSALGPIDRSKLNVNGSSLAAGHPFAATGGRIVAQLAKQLAEKKAET
ncbi:MAG: acetyl-CoA C-acetyltransferase, partial [Mycobacterium sp.]